MRLPRFNKKMIAIAAAMGIVLGAGGVAAAYFSTTGTGQTTTSVGSVAAGSFTVTAGTAAFHYKDGATPGPTALLPSTPGTTNESYALYTWTVTNTSEAVVHLATVTVSIAKTVTGYAEYTDSGTPTKITACKATWFAIGTGSTAPAASNSDTTTMTKTLSGVTLGPHSNTTSNHLTGDYTVQLVNTTTATQQGCHAQLPLVDITATS